MCAIRSRLPLAFLIAVQTTACGVKDDGPPPARNALREDVVGCLALFDERGHAVDSAFFNASPRVELDNVAVGGTASDGAPGAVWRLHRLDGAGRSMDARTSGAELESTWWADSLTDSVRLMFTTGFSGALFVLSVPAGSSDTLRGWVTEQGDAGPPFEFSRGRALAVRVPCRAR